MTPFSKVQKGIANYLDAEVMPALKDEGWKRVAAGAVIALVLQRSEKFLPLLQENQFVKTMELMNEKGEIDIEALVPVVKQQLEAQPMKLDLKIGSIDFGKFTFHPADVDKLYEYISTAKA